MTVRLMKFRMMTLRMGSSAANDGGVDMDKFKENKIKGRLCHIFVKIERLQTSRS